MPLIFQTQWPITYPKTTQSNDIEITTGDTSDDSDRRTHTIQWLEQLHRLFTPAADIKDVMKGLPNSIKTQSDRETGCSKMQGATGVQDTASMLSIDTSEVMRQMSFAGRMDYARYRSQQATASRPSGKGRQIIPPAVLAQTATTGPHEESRSTSLEWKASRATSGRSFAYRAVLEAAMTGKTLWDAQTDARQAMTKLAESKAECSREHHTITTDIEAVQGELRKTTQRNLQNQEVQVLKMDAMDCRISKITEYLDQRNHAWKRKCVTCVHKSKQ